MTDDVTFKFVNKREKGKADKTTTASLHIQFPTALAPKRDKPFEVAIEYIAPKELPKPHSGRVTVLRSDPVEVFDPATKKFKKVHEAKITVTVFFVQQVFVGKVSIRVEWTDPSGGLQERVFRGDAGSALNTSKKQTTSPYAPELATSLKETPTPHPIQELPGTGPAAQAFAVSRILQHVYTHLRWGFGNFWVAQGDQALHQGKPLSEVPDEDLNKLTPTELDECWAQLFSEAIVGTCYQGAGSFMNGDAVEEDDKVDAGTDRVHLKDAGILRVAVGRIKTDPFIPICFACQQLSSWALLFRGHTDIATNPMDAELWGKTASVKGFKRLETTQLGVLDSSKFLKKDANLKTAGEVTRWLQPGTCIFRGNPGEVMKLRHVAVVLRANSASGEIQMADTGGWTSNTLGSGQNFDSKLLEKLSFPADGALLSPPAAERKAALIDGIKSLRRARPLATGQLLVMEVGNGSVESRLLWASPLLSLHDGKGKERVPFWIARLENSLKAHPFSKLFEVRWRIWAPQNGENPQTGRKSLEDAMTKATVQPAWWRLDKAVVKPALEIGSTPGGGTKTLQRSRQFFPKALPQAKAGETEAEKQERLKKTDAIKAENAKNQKDSNPSFSDEILKDFDVPPPARKRKGTYPKLLPTQGDDAVDVPDYFEGE